MRIGDVFLGVGWWEFWGLAGFGWTRMYISRYAREEAFDGAPI